MNRIIPLASALALAAGLSAQWGGWAPRTPTTVTTATAAGYAVMAKTGTTTTKSAGIANATKILKMTSIRAATMYSSARTTLGPTYSWHAGSGAIVSEYGSTWKDRQGKGGGTAGTAQGNATKATYGSHTIAVHFDVKEGVAGVLTLFFDGNARGASMANTAVDIDGDGKPDFTATTVGSTSRWGVHKKASFNVKGTKTGVNVTITTKGAAALTSTGSHGSYGASTKVYFKGPPPPKPTLTITPYGAECGGKLASSQTTTSTHRTIKMSLTGAAANAVGYLVIGSKKISVPLPGTKCLLLTDIAILLPFRTNSSGAATQYFRAPLSSTGSFTCQDVILAFSTKGLEISSSNGLKIDIKFP